MPDNPAEEASRRALELVYKALDEGRSFRLEAGAGAGKTYSLIKALERLIERHHRDMPRRNQQIACITYTKVAKAEIESRLDQHPVVRCETNHGFCWSLIGGFQRQIRGLVEDMPIWQEKIAEAGGLGNRTFEYSLGHRAIRETSVSLHHDDILPITIALMANVKFRKLLVSRYPIILIDEYQDTDAAWVEAIKEHFLGSDLSPIFGFFGDHWQKIYGDGCGELTHPAVEEIGKGANFRSVQTVVDKLNAMRPHLTQLARDPDSVGEVKVFLTNDWVGTRQTGGHWGGDLPTDEAHTALTVVRDALQHSGWDIRPETTKILMLTHRVLAMEQGYASLPGVFRFNDSFTRKEHPYISYLVDTLEPACEAYTSKRYGEMFDFLGSGVPLMRRPSDKESWAHSMDQLNALREASTVGAVIAHLRQNRRPRLPDVIEKRERELAEADRSIDLSPVLTEIEKLHAVSYSEIRALRRYQDGSSPFETNHGVKGAEFENVLVIIGRGWNQYNFNQMLEMAALPNIPAAKRDAYERNRNLFYVAISRPKKRLALLFTQQLSQAAIGTLHRWFGADAIESVVL